MKLFATGNLVSARHGHRKVLMVLKRNGANRWVIPLTRWSR
jgi:hypothetical protein